MRTSPLLLALGLLLPFLSADGAGGVVLCQQKGNRFVLRAEQCAKREVQVPLDADTLGGKLAEDVLAPLEERLRALEELVASSTPTTTISTSTTLPGPALVSCLCADLTTQSACAPQIDCTLMYQPSLFCVNVLCADHGGPGGSSEGEFQLQCDKDAPVCQ